ncbi:MAG: MFS transporter [Myxococcota bacterium]
MATHSPLYWPYMLHYVTAVRGLEAVEFGALKAIYYVVCTVSEIPTGVVADRIGRRAALVTGAALAALGTGAIALAHSFLEFAAGEACIGVSTALMSGADSALLYDSFEGDDRDRRYARAEGRSRAAAMIFSTAALPLTDAFLVRDGDPAWAYVVTAGLCATGIASALAMVEPRGASRPAAAEITRRAVGDVVRVPGIASLFLYGIAVYVMVRAANMSFFNPVLEGAGWPVDRFGSIFALLTLIGAASAWLAPRLLDRLGERAVVLAVPAALVGMFMGLTFTRDALAVPALLCVVGVVSGLHQPVLRVMINRRAPSSERRATLLSIESMGSRIVWSAVVVFTGWALDHWPLDGALWSTIGVGSVALLGAAALRPRRT